MFGVVRIVRAYCMRTGKHAWAFHNVCNPSHYEWAEFLRRHRGVRIGANTTVNPGAGFTDRDMVTIGHSCSISSASFVTHSGYDRIVGTDVNSTDSIVIGDRCAIGAGAIILYGVRIESDCIVGAGAVVRSNVPAGSVVVGNPAQVVGTTAAYIERLKSRSADSRRRAAAAAALTGGRGSRAAWSWSGAVNDSKLAGADSRFSSG